MASGYQKRIRLAIVAALGAVAAFVIYAQTMREDSSLPPGPPAGTRHDGDARQATVAPSMASADDFYRD